MSLRDEVMTLCFPRLLITLFVSKFWLLDPCSLSHVINRNVTVFILQGTSINRCTQDREVPTYSFCHD